MPPLPARYLVRPLKYIYSVLSDSLDQIDAILDRITTKLSVAFFTLLMSVVLTEPEFGCSTSAKVMTAIPKPASERVVAACQRPLRTTRDTRLKPIPNTDKQIKSILSFWPPVRNGLIKYG